MGFIQEFKTFIARGNVVDLAVGVIIGAAFGKIVTSVVEDLIMPPIGYLMQGIDFTKQLIVLKPGEGPDKTGEVAIKYGNFINVVLQFVIVAFCVFLIVKLINSLKRKEEVQPSTPPAPSKEEALLAEIRDLLRDKKI